MDVDELRRRVTFIWIETIDDVMRIDILRSWPNHSKMLEVVMVNNLEDKCHFEPRVLLRILETNEIILPKFSDTQAAIILRESFPSMRVDDGGDVVRFSLDDCVALKLSYGGQ